LFYVAPLPSFPCTESGVVDSCSHYEQCVEPLLECGADGFTMGFGMAHCQAIERLRSNITIPWLAEWLGDHEMCLKQKVQELAHAQTCPSPDPPTCLQFELSALRAFEDCFKRNVSLLCESDELTNNASILGDQIHQVAQEIGVSDYYSGAIAAAIFRAINDTCTHPNTSHVLEPVSSLVASRHIAFCTIISGQPSSNVEDDTNILRSPQLIAGKLGRPVESFQYIGALSNDYNSLCDNAAPLPLQNLPNPLYHFVTWSPSSTDTLPDNLAESYYHYISAAVVFDFFQLDDLHSNGTCGDGIRQAGEMCDTGISNFLGVEGCNSRCIPHENYECDTTQLQRSMCIQTTCGDGLKTSNEECDDDNREPNDGCFNCQIEDNYDCTNIYNATSTCTLRPPPPTPTTELLPTSSTTSSSTTSSSTPPPTTSSGPEGSSSAKSKSSQYFIILLIFATQIIAWFDAL